MKNKGLIISKEYFPLSNGSVTCLSNLLDTFKNFYDIDLVCFKDDMESKGIENFKGYQIYRLNHWTDIPMSYREKLISDSKSLKSQFKLRKISKLFFGLNYYISKRYGLRYKEGWISNGFSAVEKKLILSDYDFVLAIAAPFENLDLALKISKAYKIPLYILQLDLFSFNPTYSKDAKDILKRLNKEKEWYENAAHIFTTTEMYSVILNSELKSFKNKITSIQIPNLVKPYCENYSMTQLQYIDILYAGMFYEDIRNPEKMFEIFNEIFKEIPNIRLHIIGYGCEEVILKYLKKWPQNIVFYGRKDKSFVNEMTMKAHILLNLSNATNAQAPSKIIEYISTGKPIINIYFIEQDRCADILKEYPLSINIKVGENPDRMIDFILDKYSKSVEFEKIKQVFFEYTPEYVVDKMLQAMVK